MHIYHFLPEQFALEDLSKGRMKLSHIDKLNDPFELWYAKQGDSQLRATLRVWKKKMSDKYGMLCFCATWCNILLWSHYADRHKGICLGFDVRNDIVKKVNYVKTRTPLCLPVTERSIERILYTKFAGWSYEEEWRAWCRLQDCDPVDPNHYFREFDENIRLREIIVGPLCTVSKTALDNAIRSYIPQPRIIKARLAFNSFRVVADKRGFGTKV